MKRGSNVTISQFFCTQCGREGLSLPRKVGQQREKGHLKILYCPHCQRLVNHVEVRPFGTYTKDDFDLEFELGRFLEDGTRIEVKDLPSCKCTKCPCNMHGKCWNSNGSYAILCEQIKEAYTTKDEDEINRLTGWEEE